MPVVDHFPTVGHLKCTVKAVYMKSFGGQKGGSSEPPQTPSAYGPVSCVQELLFQETDVYITMIAM